MLGCKVCQLCYWLSLDSCKAAAKSCLTAPLTLSICQCGIKMDHVPRKSMQMCSTARWQCRITMAHIIDGEHASGAIPACIAIVPCYVYQTF